MKIVRVVKRPAEFLGKQLPDGCLSRPGYAENNYDHISPSTLALRLSTLFWYVDLIMSGVIVVVAYRPKPGKKNELLEIVRNRVPTLRKEGLVTDLVPTIMRARDGTIIEVSEWKSREAIDAAHKNPNVLAMWDKFFAVCDCVPLNTVSETADMFAGFAPIAD
jgi:quinol monooxygenase YgiN